MSPEQESGYRLLAILVACGILSVLGVVFAGSLFFQRRQYDPFATSGDYRVYQERVMVTNLRRTIAEEFASSLVNCVSPPFSPGQNLSEEQVSESVTAAGERLSASAANVEDQKCRNSRSTHWTFESPCRLAISETFMKTTGGLDLGEISLCNAAIAKILHAAARTCAQAADFAACLVKSILANQEVKNEIDRPSESQHSNN